MHDWLRLLYRLAIGPKKPNDCDPEGENGMKQCLGYLAQLTPVRLAWTSRMYGGRFKNRQPESLQAEEWREIEAFLRTGKSEGWSLH